ncbi:MAG TPA: adenosine deaminase [bacterium]
MSKLASVPSLAAIRRMPKVELHVHLETSLRLRRLAEQQHNPGPLMTELSLIADPSKFTGYDRLRRLRYASRVGKIPDALYTPENLEQITFELLSESHAQGTRYVEVRVGGRRGFSILGTRRLLEAMARARARAEESFGVRSGFLITIVRERGPDEADARVRDAIDGADCGVVGVDLAGDEENYPPALFARPLARAREAGLGVTVHAGEFAGPASIWTAVYQVGATRLGHGIRAVEDPDLLTYLRDHQITLEVCPSSNMRLGLCATIGQHPVGKLLQLGVPVTINSDDPVLLGTDLSQELHTVATVFSLSQAQLSDLMRGAARAAFIPADQVQWLQTQL